MTGPRPRAPGSAGAEPSADASGRRSLEGTLERITYHNEDNGYTVARLMPRGRSHLVTVIGNMAGVNVGASLQLWGRWTSHAKFGKQFAVEDYKERLPATVEGIRRYLGSGLIRGVGPVTADRIVAHFGIETLGIIESAPDRLIEVPGVGGKRVSMITDAWAEQQQIKEIMLFLQGHEVTTSLAVKIFKQYGDESIEIVQRDPYRLARDVYGIGFVTADKIARRMGFAADSPERIEAGLLFTLGQLADDGHVFAPRNELVDTAAKLLEVEPDGVEPAIDRLAAVEAVVIERGPVESDGAELDERQAVYLPPFYYSEVGIANRLRDVLEDAASRLSAFRSVSWDGLFDDLARRDPYPLAARQRDAVRTALSRKVSVLTGGPGTGKTTTVRTIIRLLAMKNRSVALAAPTGRAAKRLAETCGMEAKTVHRLLEFKPTLGRPFLRDRDNPIDADIVIVDEVSMVDVLLMNHLAKAVDPASHLLLVGDIDQLPSVGAGNVLRDLIDSGVVPTVVLDQIFRQSARSHIVVNAHRINKGEMPRFPQETDDFFLFRVEEAEAAAEMVVDVVANRIPRKFGLDPLEDIQVLSPMHRGAAGVTELNRRLQETLNPPAAGKPEARFGGRVYRLGDRVMQIRNNYDKDVYNGDLGRVTRIDTEDQAVTVAFAGTPVAYEYSQLDELIHAFACSTHKSQGAEYPAVVMALLPAHFMMLQRNLLYTGVTRARKLCVLVGSQRAIAMAVKNDKVARRHTSLAIRLREPDRLRAVEPTNLGVS